MPNPQSSIATASPKVSTLYLLSTFIVNNKISSDHRVFTITISSQFGHKYYHQAIKFPHW